MKRYYTFQTPPDVTTYRPRGSYHWMSLPKAGGYLCVVMDEETDPHPDWAELPHLLDGATAAALKDFGCLPTDTMFQAAKKLAAVNRFFRP